MKLSLDIKKTVYYNRQQELQRNTSMIIVERKKEFLEWFNSLNPKEEAQVEARLNRIENDEHFGDVKSLGDGLAELRWKNGWRVYFIRVSDKKIILLLGGHKNEQKKNIKKARLHLE